MKATQVGVKDICEHGLDVTIYRVAMQDADRDTGKWIGAYKQEICSRCILDQMQKMQRMQRK